MVTSIEATSSQTELYKLLSQKSVDGTTKGASLDEIRKAKMHSSEETQPFAKFLADNFDALDADKSGTLTVSEVNTYFKNQMGISQMLPETTLTTASTQATDSKTSKGPDILAGLMSIAQNPQVQNTIGAAISKAASAYGGQIGSKVTSMIGLK